VQPRPAGGRRRQTGVAGVTPAGDPPESPDARRPDLAGLAAWTTLAQLVLPLTSLISGPILARVLGPGGRGVYAAVLSPLLVLSFLAQVGLPDATTYAVARLRIPRGHALVITGRLTLVYGLVASALLIIFAPALLEKTPQAVTLMRLIALTLPLLMFLNLLRQATAGSADFRWRNIERVVMSLVRLIGLVLLAILGWLTAASAVWVTVVSSLIGLPLLLVALFGWNVRAGMHEDVQTRAERPHLTRELAKYGFRGWAGTFAYLVNWRLDQAVMVVLVSSNQLGYYAVAVSLAELPQTAFLQLKNILFAESAARDSMILIARASRILIATTSVLSVLGMLASPIIVPLMFGRKFEPAVLMAQILLAGTIPFLVDAVLGAGLLSLGSPGRRSVGQLVAAVITVAGLFILCPRIGAVGAAWTSLAAYTISALITMTIFCRTTGFRHREVLLLTREDVRWLRDRLGRLRRRLHRGGRRANPQRSS
jgi:O-antigen/teichoic acid export membrane protein